MVNLSPLVQVIASVSTTLMLSCLNNCESNMIINLLGEDTYMASNTYNIHFIDNGECSQHCSRQVTPIGYVLHEKRNK